MTTPNTGGRAFVDRGLAGDNSRTMVALDGGNDIFTPGPLPPTGGMLVGATLLPSSNAQMATLEGQLGAPLGVLRLYDSNFPTSWANSQGSVGNNKPLVISSKPNIPSFANGSLDAQFNTILDGAPTNRKIWWTLGQHEPDVKINGGQYTVAQWRAAAIRMGNLVHARAVAAWNTVVITTMQPWDPPGQHAYAPADFWIPGVTDFWSIDKFNPNSTPDSNPAYRSLASFISDGVDYFAANDIRWMITESNTYEKSTDLTAKPSWMTAAAQYCFANGCEVFTYWDKGFASDADQNARRLRSSSGSLNAWKNVLQTYNP